MSGHNKWSTIKRRKGAQDAKRSKIFTKLIKEITIAAKMGGGDPDGNPRLRRALETARVANLPRENIKRAIAKGTGELEGVNYEELLYEGVGAGGSLFVVQALTDNRNRSAAELRKIFEKGGGQMGGSGAAAWAFDEKGIIKLAKDAADEEQLFELAVGGGAEDLQGGDEEWVVITARSDLESVREAIVAGGVAVTSADLEMIPKTPKEVGPDTIMKLVALFDALDDHDDVQKVFSDFEPTEEAMAALAAAP